MSSIQCKSLTKEERHQLAEALKRCPEGTLEAAIAFQETGDKSHVPIIVMGILERFLEPNVRDKLHQNDVGELRVLDDLGVDSLTMVEIVMLVEETLNVTVDNEDLRDLRTVNDIHHYLNCKLQGIEAPETSRHLSIVDIDQVLPHKQPFLFLQEATISPDEACGLYRISGSEFFLEGHFAGNPVFPASIMLEALGQLAVLYILQSDSAEFTSPRDPKSIYFTSCNGVRVQRICRPGDTLKLSVKPKKLRHPVGMFEGSIKVNGEKTAYVEEVCLTFDYIQETPNEAPQTMATT